MITLLVIAVLINYVDPATWRWRRAAQPRMGMSASQLGVLLSAFFWTYVLLQVPMGWLVDVQRQRAARGRVPCVVRATIFTGLARGFATLLGMRLLLGMGKPSSFPPARKSSARTSRRRIAASPTACWWRHPLGHGGGRVRGGLLMAHFGWRRTFLAIGLLGLLWCRHGSGGSRGEWRTSPGTRRGTAELRNSFGTIVRLRPFWGASIGTSVRTTCSTAHELAAFYLVHERHLSTTAMAWTAGMIYAIDSTAAIVTGRIADLWIRRGMSACSARKWPMVAGLLIAVVSLLGCAWQGKDLAPFLVGAAIGVEPPVRACMRCRRPSRTAAGRRWSACRTASPTSQGSSRRC